MDMGTAGRAPCKADPGISVAMWLPDLTYLTERQAESLFWLSQCRARAQAKSMHQGNPRHSTASQLLMP